MHTIVILDITEPNIVNGMYESHITCTCGYAMMFANKGSSSSQARLHAKSHPLGANILTYNSGS